MRKLLLLKLIVIAILLSSCKKMLDIKPDKTLVVPATLQDMQVMLDYVSVMNTGRPGGAGEASTDNYYLSDDNYNSLYSNDPKNLYIWALGPTLVNVDLSDWYFGYRSIYYANVVLEGLYKMKDTTDLDYRNIKGSALFFRALSFYEIAALYCKPYIANSNDSELGLPLRLSADINQVYPRATLKETYDRIINDLILSVDLLPVEPFNNFKTRPTKPAAYALLARIHLFMQDYDKTLYYSTKALELFNTLLDFNTDINAASATAPIAQYNKETIFYAHTYDYGVLTSTRGYIDTALLRSYDDNDIRSTAFFRNIGGGTIFKGTYVGSRFQLVFTGIATDEIYLTRAECYARKGDIDNAMNDLNTLMVKRWKNNGTFIPYTALDSIDALTKVLTERRKELLFRGLRWLDLKRLNTDPRFAVTLKRVVNGKEYFLPPGDTRYTFPIPGVVIKASGIPQN